MMEGGEVEKDGKKTFTPGARMELRRGPADMGTSVTLSDMLDFYFNEKKRQDGKPFNRPQSVDTPVLSSGTLKPGFLSPYG
jgi:hypothetical protein